MAHKINRMRKSLWIVVPVIFLAIGLLNYARLSEGKLDQLERKMQNLHHLEEVRSYLDNIDAQWTYYDGRNYRGHFATYLKKLPQAHASIVVDVVDAATMLRGERRYDFVIFFDGKGRKLKTLIREYDVQGPI